MTKLAQTLGLTEMQTEIVSTVRQFVEKEVIPNAQELERRHLSAGDRRRHAGDGPVRADDSRGVRRSGESLLTYALCVEELARGWMSVSGVINTHFIVAYMIRQHGTEEQKRDFCRGWRPARRAAPSRCPSPNWAPTSRRSAPGPRETPTAPTPSTARRCG